MTPLREGAGSSQRILRKGEVVLATRSMVIRARHSRGPQWLLQVAGDPLLEAVGLRIAFVDDLDAVGFEHRHLADAREMADVVRRVLAAGEIDEVARAGVDDAVRLAVEREGDEVARADLDLVFADLR